MRLFLITVLVMLSHQISYGESPFYTSADSCKYWNLPTGSKIAYYYFRGNEPRNSVPVIFLHGGPGAHVTPQDIQAYSQLTKFGYDVYLYDQIGSSYSARLKNIREYSVKRHLKDLEAIVELIGAQKVNFIAHSWGASLAPAYLAKHPEKVEALIFSGPGGIIPKRYSDLMIALPDSVKLKNRENIRYFPSKLLEPKAYQRYSKICNYAGLGIRIATDNEIDSLLDQLMSNLSKQKAANTHLPCSGGDEKGSGGYSHIRTGLTIDRGKDNRAMLSKLNTPLLILLGESDQISWGCIADYLKVFRNVKLVIIPNSGHSVFTCQPDLCLKLTSEFLSSTSECEPLH